MGIAVIEITAHTLWQWLKIELVISSNDLIRSCKNNTVIANAKCIFCLILMAIVTRWTFYVKFYLFIFLLAQFLNRPTFLDGFLVKYSIYPWHRDNELKPVTAE